MATTTPPSPATCQSNFEQGVALALHLWPALTLAVQNNWGGPDSADKRDWFAGAVADLFPDVSRLTPAQLALKAQQLSQNQSQSQSQSQSQQQNGTAAAEEPDQEDVETVLLQVMLDEFEVNVDDDSAWEVAETVVRLRSECLKGKFEGVEELRRRWEARKGDKVVFKKAENEDDDDDEDSEEDDSDEGEDADGDVEMDDAAPQLVNTRKEPEVDEDGFIKVSRRRK